MASTRLQLQLIDFCLTSSRRRPAPADAPVVIDEMHYGGLMIRGHADWQEHKTFDYLTNEGKTKVDGNHTRP